MSILKNDSRPRKQFKNCVQSVPFNVVSSALITVVILVLHEPMAFKELVHNLMHSFCLLVVVSSGDRAL